MWQSFSRRIVPHPIWRVRESALVTAPDHSQGAAAIRRPIRLRPCEKVRPASVAALAEEGARVLGTSHRQSL